jgi:ADP-ribose pyrophosphatase
MSWQSGLPSHPDVEVESVERVWSGRFPLDRVRFRHRRFDGAVTRLKTWELWRRGKAAALLPYDPVRDAVLLIEQFRLPALAAGLDPVVVEIPAGLCDPGESAEETVRREVKEEMGVETDRLHAVGRFILTAGGADEVCTVFAGRVRAPEPEPDGVIGYAGAQAEDEDILVRLWDAEAAIAAAVEGRFPNSVTAISLLWLNAAREKLRREWMA